MILVWCQRIRLNKRGYQISSKFPSLGIDLHQWEKVIPGAQLRHLLDIYPPPPRSGDKRNAYVETLFKAEANLVRSLFLICSNLVAIVLNMFELCDSTVI